MKEVGGWREGEVGGLLTSVRNQAHLEKQGTGGSQLKPKGQAKSKSWTLSISAAAEISNAKLTSVTEQ